MRLFEPKPAISFPRLGAACALALALGVISGADRSARAQVARSGEATPSAWVEREAHVMGTRLRIRVAAQDRRDGLRASESALEAIRRVEDLVSTWTSDSNLSRLNSSSVGQPAHLPSRLGEVLREVLRWSSETNGAFEPRSGALIEAWGLRTGGRSPSGHDLHDALVATGPGAVTVSADGSTATRHHPSAWIDAGGFGKGLALREAGRALREAGIEDGILDFGGQILTLGRDRGGAGRTSIGRGETAWRISVAHPAHRFRAARTLEVGAASVSTSGGSERFVVQDGEILSHVVDSRTGRSVPPWGSVTVVSEDPLVADVVSTALFVLGPDEGMAWARNRSDVGVLFLPADRAPARWNETLEPLLMDRSGGEDDTPVIAAEEGP